MADFTIVAPEPFVVEGTKGTYELPRWSAFDGEQMERFGEMSEGAEGLAEQAKAARGFLYYLCPEIEREPLTDMMCLQLLKAMGEGSGIAMGEF